MKFIEMIDIEQPGRRRKSANNGNGLEQQFRTEQYIYQCFLLYGLEEGSGRKAGEMAKI